MGVPDGMWPSAGNDVALAVEFVRELPVDQERVVLVGHSAGGQLALWAGKRAKLPVVALAPVSDVRESAARTGPDGPPARFMAPEHFADGSPLELLPLGVPQLVIHGTEDESVPYEMSQRYVEAAAGEAELVTLEGCGHFEPIDPISLGVAAGQIRDRALARNSRVRRSASLTGSSRVASPRPSRPGRTRHPLLRGRAESPAPASRDRQHVLEPLGGRTGDHHAIGLAAPALPPRVSRAGCPGRGR